MLILQPHFSRTNLYPTTASPCQVLNTGTFRPIYIKFGAKAALSFVCTYISHLCPLGGGIDESK